MRSDAAPTARERGESTSAQCRVLYSLRSTSQDSPPPSPTPPNMRSAQSGTGWARAPVTHARCHVLRGHLASGRWVCGTRCVREAGHNDGRRRPLPNYTARNRDQQRMPSPPFFVFLGTGGRTGHTMLSASTSGTRAAHMRPATWTSSPLARGGLKSCDPAPAVPAWAGRRAEAAVGASNLAYDEALYRGKTGAARQ